MFQFSKILIIYLDSPYRRVETRGGYFQTYRNVTAPVKALIGPWDHDYPHNAVYNPQIEWRHEAVLWFDHWLKNVDTGIMDEPKFNVFVRDWHHPFERTNR